jgi:hypothetical protein
MNGFFDRVLGQLGAGLTDMGNETDLIHRFAGCLRLVKEAIAELKRELRGYTFKGKAEEIIYFRDQAPKVYSQLFYYMKVYAVESYRRHISPEGFRRVLQLEMKRIEQFYARHRQLVQHAPGGESFWDDRLYTRQGYGDWWADDEVMYIDEDFTIGSYWVAMNTANAELMQWLKGQLEALDRPAAYEAHGVGRKGKLVWTANLVDLVELAYALHLKGCLNNGQATLKDTMEGLAAFLGADPGKYHITIQEIARRKISPTKFLKSLTEELQRKLDEMQ